MKKIIRRMSKERKKNGGMPIVSAVYSYDKEYIDIQSNKPRGNLKWEEIHLSHAEWLAIDMLESKKLDASKMGMIISTTPCEMCSRRIIEKNFKSVEYLFKKHESNEDAFYENIPNIKLYNPKSADEVSNIRIIKNHWNISNLTNKKKTQKNKKNK